MGIIKDINIKNRTYYFFNDIIRIKDLNPDLLKIDKKLYKNINIYYIGYITMKETDYVKTDYIVQILCTLLLIKQMDTLKKAMEINIQL